MVKGVNVNRDPDSSIFLGFKFFSFTSSIIEIS